MSQVNPLCIMSACFVNFLMTESSNPVFVSVFMFCSVCLLFDFAFFFVVFAVALYFCCFLLLNKLIPLLPSSTPARYIFPPSFLFQLATNCTDAVLRVLRRLRSDATCFTQT